MGLQHVQDRVIVRIDMDAKNWTTFEDGTKIRLERKYDNFNMRYTQPVNAIVVSGEGLPEGAEILIHHNANHDTNRVFNYQPLSGNEIASDVRYLSILHTECFAYYDGSEWLPLQGFDFGLRVFEPYSGFLQGIEPTILKNTLYVTTGEYKGLVCRTLKACDYEIVFQDKNGKEGNLIRFRSSEDEKNQREMEIVAIDHDLTNKVLNGECHIGLTKTDCKPLNSYINDRRRTKQNDTIIAT